MDLSDLFNEISAEQPCGADLEYDQVRLALNTAIQGTPEDQFSGQKGEPPNWRDIQKQAIALLQKSKDIQIVLYLIRAAIHLEGISGFRDTLNLLEKTLTDYWPTVYPLLDPDDGDATQRLNIVEELCSRELVLNPLSLSPLAESKSIGRFTLRDILYANEKLPVPDGITKPDTNMIRAVFNENDIETLLPRYQAIIESEQLLQKIETSIADNVGGVGNGVNLESLKSLLKEIRYYFEQFAGDRLSDESSSDQEVDEQEEAVSSVQVSSGRKNPAQGVGEIHSRQDVLKALDLINKYYAEHEPSSPVPLLMQRAKYLVTANFMEIMQNIAPDGLTQLEYIKGPDPEAESGY